MLRMPSCRYVLFAPLLVSLSVATDLQAQSTRLGNELQVNVFTTNSQRTPRAAGDAQGNFIVIWENNLDTYGRQVFANGALSDEFFINFSSESRIARAPSGEFVVAYRAARPNVVRAQIFDALGNQQGADILVSEDDGLSLAGLDIEMAADGDFVVVWSTYSPGQRDVFARQLAFDGTAKGDPFQVNSYVGGTQDDAAVAIAANGDFAVAWTSIGSPGDDDSYTSIQGRLYASNGQSMGDQFQVNPVAVGFQDRSDVARLADGSWAFVWADDAIDPDQGITLQRVDASGQPVGPWRVVNNFTEGRQALPMVAALDDGGFVVSWESEGSFGDDSFRDSVQARLFDSLGVPVEGQYQVNSYIPTSQNQAHVATAPNQQVLVVWESRGSSDDDNSLESIHGQRFGPLVAEVFLDGFESGDTTTWDDAAP